MSFYDVFHLLCNRTDPALADCRSRERRGLYIAIMFGLGLLYFIGMLIWQRGVLRTLPMEEGETVTNPQ